MVLTKPWTTLTAVTGWNHPAEEAIAYSIIAFLTLLSEAWVASIPSSSTISAATTMTRITAVAVGTIHAVCIAAVLTGVAVHRCVTASHVAAATIAHPAVAGITHAVARRTTFSWAALRWAGLWYVAGFTTRTSH